MQKISLCHLPVIYGSLVQSDRQIQKCTGKLAFLLLIAGKFEDLHVLRRELRTKLNTSIL